MPAKGKADVFQNGRSLLIPDREQEDFSELTHSHRSSLTLVLPKDEAGPSFQGFQSLPLGGNATQGVSRPLFLPPQPKYIPLRSTKV